jgi:hypothetical protein
MRPGLAADGPTDVIVLFVTERHELQARLERGQTRDGPGRRLLGRLAEASVEGAHGRYGGRRARRRVADRAGRQTKVCAIDEIWSGLRLVIRRENRIPAT